MIDTWNTILKQVHLTSAFVKTRLIEGCMDETAFNFDQEANVEGTCIPKVVGVYGSISLELQSISQCRRCLHCEIANYSI